MQPSKIYCNCNLFVEFPRALRMNQHPLSTKAFPLLLTITKRELGILKQIMCSEHREHLHHLRGTRICKRGEEQREWIKINEQKQLSVKKDLYNETSSDLSKRLHHVALLNNGKL